jgi:hypothetical protein
MSYYEKEASSAMARAKRVLKKAEFTLSRVTGRYHPFNNQQRVSHGVRVSVVGCSDTIALTFHMPFFNSAELAEYKARVLACLRANGLPFDDRCWLNCKPTGYAAIIASREEARARVCPKQESEEV